MNVSLIMLLVCLSCVDSSCIGGLVNFGGLVGYKFNDIMV